MFIVSSTRFGISQIPTAYAQFSAAIARAAVAKGAPTDRSQIYEVAAASAGEAISAMNSGKAVFVDALAQAAPAPVTAERQSANAAKAEIMAAMTSALLAKSAERP
ncbi:MULTISPECIES: hypothetical protein [Methylocystis]|uniref:hypothetical protein n=1 Tax=Methylocystis TaxID=133 RepID=UPI0024BA3329|nr:MULTISPECIES: hypothetical protein [Methylocystis]MDJ0447623.1 hypothetical protein [Methylocystis sp. JR02]